MPRGLLEAWKAYFQCFLILDGLMILKRFFCNFEVSQELLTL